MMDRLTVWEDNKRGGKWSYHMDASVNDLCAKLAAYEDTGLAPDEIAALRAELDALKADIEAGRLVRLEPCDECRYKLESQAWEYYTYPCRECRQRTKSHFARAEAARAALEGGQQ